MVEETDRSQFKPGQVWRYAARPGEEGSTITVLKVEMAQLVGVILHIRINGVKVRNLQSKDGITPTIGHIPISEEAVLSSVPKLAGMETGELDFEGYRMWREAFDAGKAGVFTISVAECVEFMEKAINPS